MTGSTHKTFFGSQRGLVFSNAGVGLWRTIDKGMARIFFKYHLDTLAALAITTYEMMEFGRNMPARSLPMRKSADETSMTWVSRFRPGLALPKRQIALDVNQYGGSDEVSTPEG